MEEAIVKEKASEQPLPNKIRKTRYTLERQFHKTDESALPCEKSSSQKSLKKVVTEAKNIDQYQIINPKC